MASKAWTWFHGFSHRVWHSAAYDNPEKTKNIPDNKKLK
jgi:hypothetical protein